MDGQRLCAGPCRKCGHRGGHGAAVGQLMLRTDAPGRKDRRTEIAARPMWGQEMAHVWGGRAPRRGLGQVRQLVDGQPWWAGVGPLGGEASGSELSRAPLQRLQQSWSPTEGRCDRRPLGALLGLCLRPARPQARNLGSVRTPCPGGS